MTEIAAARQKNFDRMIDLVFATHPFYRRALADQGIRRADLRSVKDLAAVRVTLKADYAADPEAFVLERDALTALSLPERTLWGVLYTSGTSSGRPTPFYDTAYDHVARIAQLREMALCVGVTTTDVVANCFPLSAVPHQGFVTALYGPLGVGAKVIAGLTGVPSTPFNVYRSTDELARSISAQGVTVLWGITSYLRRLLLRAGTLGLDLSGVRLLIAAGESFTPGMRDDLKRRLSLVGAGNVAVRNSYGFTEMQGPTWQCADDGPSHIAAAARYQFDVVDAASGTGLPDGRRGRLLMTHLDRRGTVLLRYAMGDECAYEETTACGSCGRTGPRLLGPITRADHLVKLRGTLIDPDAVIDAVSRVPEVDDFMVRVDRVDDDDTLIVLYSGLAAAEAIARAVREGCEIRPTVRLVPREHFEPNVQNYKFRRFADLRRSLSA